MAKPPNVLADLAAIPDEPAGTYHIKRCLREVQDRLAALEREDEAGAEATALQGLVDELTKRVAVLERKVTALEAPAAPVAEETVPACRVYNSANISIPDNNLTLLTFNSDRRDEDDMHSTVSNTSRITVPAGKAGWYAIGACVEFAATAATALQCRIRLNGSTVIAIVTDDGGTAADQKRLNPKTEYYLAAGDYVEVLVYQNSGAPLNVNAAGDYSPTFWAVKQAQAA